MCLYKIYVRKKFIFGHVRLLLKIREKFLTIRKQVLRKNGWSSLVHILKDITFENIEKNVCDAN